MPANLEKYEVTCQRAPEAVRMLTSLLVLHPSIGSVRLVDGDTVMVLEFYMRKRLSTSQLREFIKELRQAYQAFDLFNHASERQLKIYRADKGRRSVAWRSAASLDPDSSDALPAVSLSEPMEPKNSDDDLTDCMFDVDRSVLEKMHPMTFAEYWDGLIEAVECLVVERDVASLTVQEIEMLVEIMRDEFRTRLVEGVNAFIDDEHLMLEAENLNSCLEALKTRLELNGRSSVATSSEIIAYRDELRVVVFVANNDKMVNAAVS
ncbi:MAG: hypothetical protein Q4F00_06580 [bacterium]|nr:hypothetical protein [bacterium]